MLNCKINVNFCSLFLFFYGKYLTTYEKYLITYLGKKKIPHLKGLEKAIS
jgi:hypothetical protein